jgi:hypothetical protein
MTNAVIIAQQGSNNTTFRNRIINGAMVIDQRNAGASVTLVSSGIYTVDRWQGYEDTDGVMTAQQDSSSPTGFINSLKLTTTTADSSLAATQFSLVQQKIEGLNIADLNWGATAAAAGKTASSVNLSFWVKSSLTGTFGGALRNSAQDRSYPFSYTITSADTWEQKTVTIAGDTSGTWLTTNGIGIQIAFGLGVGSTYSGTAGSWAAAQYFSATGATSVIGTLNATFYITGVQLEAGSTASPFEYRSYGTELSLCERYYWKSTVGTYNAVGSGVVVTGSQVSIYIKYPTTMRSAPTVSYSGTVYVLSVSSITVTSISSSYAGNFSGRFDFVPSSSPTTGQGSILFTEQTGTNFVQATAEL